MKKYCTACGNVASPIEVMKGSSITSFFLTLCFLLPGIIYMIWRANSKHEACPSCGSPQVIPVDSPMAKKLMGDDYAKMKAADAAAEAAEVAERARQQRAAAAQEAARPWIARGDRPALVVAVMVVVMAVMLVVSGAIWDARHPVSQPSPETQQTDVPQPASPPSTDSWLVDRHDKNPIDGSVDVFLSSDSTSGGGSLVLDFHNGRLASGTDIGARVNVPKYSMPNPIDGEEYETQVKVKFDQGKEAIQTWGISDDRTAIVPQNGRQFLTECLKHKTLYVQYDLYDGPYGVVDTFDLTGLAARMKTENLHAN